MATNPVAVDPWDAAASMVGAQLLDDVSTFIGRFVAYPSPEAQTAHALWIAHAHLMDAWESTPRLAFLSPEPGSGKSRALEVTELIVPRPMHTANMSASALFRSISGEDGPPTVLLDEVDAIFAKKSADATEDLRGLLNAGHRRGATVMRCVVRGKAVDVEAFPSYAAVALAGLGDLPDTLMSRSIIIRMRRRAPTERVEPFRHRLHSGEGDQLRERLAAWAADVEQAVRNAWPTMPDGVNDRAADCWEALLAVADAIGGEWPDRARATAVTLVTLSREGAPSLGVRLLSDLKIVFGNEDAMTTEHILSELHKMDEAPWGDLRGKPLDARGLARRLKPYGISPTTVRTLASVAKGYRREDLHDSWQRYVGVSPLDAVTSVTTDTGGCPRCGGDGCSWCEVASSSSNSDS